MRIVFAGTPTAAVPSLNRLLRPDSGHEVVAVLTRPDAKAGRGRGVRRSPVREVAEAAGVPVLTPRTAGTGGALLAELSDLAPDACPVVAYGLLLPAPVLAVPTHGWVNLHFSLLPAWRGAAPVQHALLAGDQVTGASTFLLDEGMDTGPVLGTMTETIRARDTAGDLLDRLAVAGAELLAASLDALQDGSAVPQPQSPDGVSYAPKLTVDQARVDWSRPDYVVDRQVRGVTPAPGAWTTWRGDRVKLGPVRVVDAPPGRGGADPGALPAGGLRVAADGVLVGTGTGTIRLGDVQPPGKRMMAATDWARGARLAEGEVFV